MVKRKSDLAHVLDRDMYGKYKYSCGFVPKIEPSLSSRLYFGSALSAEQLQHLPQAVDIDNTEATLPGSVPPSIITVNTNGGPWIVSGQVKTLIESLEPTVHVFFPIDVLVTDQLGSVSYSDYYLLHLTQSIDCVVLEKTGIPRQGGGMGSVGKIVVGFGVCTLRADAVAGFHLWRGGRDPSGLRTLAYDNLSNIFASDDLYRLFVDHNVTGMKSHIKCEIE